MISRSVHMIFEASGQPVPTEDEVRFEAREIVQRTGWGLPLIERLRKVADPYWREAIARCLFVPSFGISRTIGTSLSFQVIIWSLPEITMYRTDDTNLCLAIYIFYLMIFI